MKSSMSTENANGLAAVNQLIDMTLKQQVKYDEMNKKVIDGQAQHIKVTAAQTTTLGQHKRELDRINAVLARMG